VTYYPYNVPDPFVPIPGGSSTTPLDRFFQAGADAQLGYGLIRPFRRDEKNDFANAGGERLVRACVGQVLGTFASSPENPDVIGELRWNSSFGSLLYLLRHKSNNLVTQQLAKFYVAQALARWEPRVRLKEVEATVEETPGQGKNKLVIRLKYDFVASSGSNNVILPDIEQTVTV
jgi:phage baseplate assembly protein W